MRGGQCRLLLLRHGQSEWNVDGRWQGDADPPLTAEGRHQAAHAASALTDLGPFSAVWSSDLIRATETAEILGSALQVFDIQRHPGLRESGLGPWQGLTVEQIEAQWPGYLAERRRPPGAEDAHLVLARFTRAITDIARDSRRDETILVITHAGVMRQLRRALQRPDVRFTNLAGFWVHVDRKTAAIEVGGAITTVDAPLPESL